MKRIIFFLFTIFICLKGYAQSIYPIRTDTLKVYTGSVTPGAGGELLLQNASRTVLNGLLTNINGRGNTVFRNLVLNKTESLTTGTILGITDQDTIGLPWVKPYMDTMYFSGGDLLYEKNGNTYTLPVPLSFSAGNLLTLAGSTLNLGGTATGATSLVLGFNGLTTDGSDASSNTISQQINASSAANYILIGTTPAGTNSTFILDGTNNTLNSTDGVNNRVSTVGTSTSNSQIAYSINTNTVPNTSQLAINRFYNRLTDHINYVGFIYGDNYAANAGDRWLTDKGYVDSLSANLGTSYIKNATTPVQTANYWISGKGSLSQSIIYNPISVPFTQYLNFSHDGSDTTKKTWSFGVSGTPSGSPFHTGDSLTLRSYTNTGTFLRDVMVFYRNGIVRFPGTNQLILGNTGGVGQELTVHGLSVFNAPMQVNGNYEHTGGIREHTTTTVTGDYTVLSTDLYINVNNTADCIITLPAAQSSPPTGNLFYIKKTINNAFTVTIVVAGGTQTIDGGANYILIALNNSVQVHDDGANYFIYSSH